MRQAWLAVIASGGAMAAPALAQRSAIGPGATPALDDWRRRPAVECVQPPQAPGLRSLWNANLWPGGVVPYEFDGNVSLEQRQAMRGAMDILEGVADVRFVARGGQADCIHVRASTGNGSYVGVQGGAQVINIYNWNIPYIMVHELMHALGVWHEHARPDRDAWVTVDFANIQPQYAFNFSVAATGTPVGPYDFESVMHYAPCSFSVCCPSGTVCPCEESCAAVRALPEYSASQALMGQRTHLSAGDIAGLVGRYGPPPGPGVVNIDAATRCSGSWAVSRVALGPGSYALIPIRAGGPEGGRYEAWMGGAGPALCAGDCCEQGWVWSYEVQVDGGAWVPVGQVDCPRATPEEACWAHARTGYLDLPAGGAAAFRISDATCADNTGGVSIRVARCAAINSQPSDAAAVVGRPAVFSVVATPGIEPSFRWRHGGVDLADGPGIQGSGTPTLTVVAASADDAGMYDVVVADQCGAVTSEPAVLTVYCPADWNRDYAVSPLDIAVFVNDWSASLAAGTLEGDVDGDGIVTPADVGVFVSLWFASLGGSC